jgi:hypothetical protein
VFQCLGLLAARDYDFREDNPRSKLASLKKIERLVEMLACFKFLWIFIDI